MKIKDRFNLSHIFGFVVGIVTTIAINWILFKDPKRVTAPGLAALVALCTFSLALWSAFKVDKWLNSKVNEKAFKRTEEFLDSYIDLALNIAKIYSIAKYIRNKTTKQIITDRSIIRNINEFAPEFLNSILTVAVHENTFKNWGIIFKHRKAHRKIMSRLKIIVPIIRRMNEIAYEFDNSTTQEKDANRMKEYSTTIIQYIDSVYYSVDGIVKRSYSDIFDYTVTSPVKKVD
ncbi:hypothetical protein [Kluyvera georgiana]|uniref:hypothetical protein n=1 Tax=Kluyvera georgiana TaxID=73098 RepID=UPI003F66FA36